MYVTGSLPEVIYTNIDALENVLESILTMPTQANTHCVDVVNFLQYAYTELLKAASLSENATYVPLKDKIVHIDYNGTGLERIIENAEIFNAFWSCTVRNLRFGVGVYMMLKFNLFENMSFLTLVNYINNAAVGLAYNAEYCTIAADILRNGLPCYGAKNNQNVF